MKSECRIISTCSSESVTALSDVFFFQQLFRLGDSDGTEFAKSDLATGGGRKVYTVSHEISNKHLIRGRTTLATAIARTAAAGCRSSVALVWVAPAAG